MKQVFKKMLSMVLVLQLVLSVFVFTTPVSAEVVNRSRMLKTSGNKIVLEENPDVVVRLTGVNIPGGEWTGTPGVERIARSTKEAMENWNSNVIRLPVSIKGWYGTYDYVNDGGVGFRNYIDSIISMASEAGKYIILDLHHYKYFDNQAYLTFWTEAATKYKNNPTVLFGILNEPHGTTWPIWRNGNGSNVTGHQQVVEMIRDLGAKNIIVAGGLDWGYNLKGITGHSGDSIVYALIDQGSNNDLSKAGNGIMYDTHIYPWKGTTSSWHAAVGTARMLYPILVGECGWQSSDVSSGKPYTPGSPQYYDNWNPEFFKWMNDEATYGNLANWTGWSFHPSASPIILANPNNNWKDDVNYDYPPTATWGVFVKQELKANLGLNAAIGKTVESSASDSGYANTNAIDDNPSSLWASSAVGDKYITVDLWSNYEINRWVVRHAGTKGYDQSVNTKDFKLQVSNNNTTWTDVDVITGNTNNITDRFIEPITARYARLYVTQAAQTNNDLKIYEFSVFGKESKAIMNSELPATVVGNAGRGTINQWFVAQNFEGAENQMVADTANPKVIHAPNRANDNYIKWNQNTAMTSNFYAVNSGDAINASKHILGTKKANIPIEMTVDTHDANGAATAAPVFDNGKLIYADMRIKRVDIADDPVSLKLMDSSGNEIFEVSFTANSIPQLVASQTYGVLTLNPLATVVSYPYSQDWIYLRARIDFDSKTFELYQGPTMNTMVPFVKGISTLEFKNANAENLYKIQAGNHGALGFDDVNIYSVSPPFAPPTHAVRFNLDATTIATKTVEHGAAITNMPIVPIKAGFIGTWDTPDSTIITQDTIIRAVYTIVPKVLETNMNNTNLPDIWGTWSGTSASYIAGKAEDGVGKAFHITGGEGGGGTQLALIPGGFSNFVGFDAFRIRLKSNASFKIRMKLEYRVDNPDTILESKAVTIPSTDGEWMDVLISASDLKPDEDGDWIYNMKSAYTTNFQPVVLMRFEETNFGSSNYATIGNMKALWDIEPKITHTVTFIADGITVATRTVVDGETLTNIPLVPEIPGLKGVWNTTNYTNITSDKTVTAVYSPITYKVTFIADNVTVATRTVNYGATLTDIPNVPAKIGFKGVWNTTDYSNITADRTVTAIYSPAPIVTYTVTFMVDDAVYTTRTVNEGSAVTNIPSVPVKAGLYGAWDPADLTNITSDLTVTAVYTETPPDKLTIGTITMSGPEDGFLTFHVPYIAIDVERVTILTVIGSEPIAPINIMDSDIAYMDEQAPTGLSSFVFKVKESKFTETNNKIFISIGGTGVYTAIAGEPQTYPPTVVPGEPYSTSATVTVTVGVVNVSYEVQNNRDYADSASIIVALYDSNDALIGIEITADNYTSNELKSYSYLKDCTDLNYSYFKLFVFDDMMSMQPVALIYDSRQ